MLTFGVEAATAYALVLGLFVYTLVVMSTGGNFSALAGALALAFIVLPVVVRTTDEMLRLVPAQMREAALSLGVPQWKVIVQVLYRASLRLVDAIRLSNGKRVCSQSTHGAHFGTAAGQYNASPAVVWALQGQASR